MVEYILTTNIVMSKGHEYIPARSWLGNGLLTSNGDKEWKAHRKAISRTFHKDIYHNYISVFERNSNIFVKQLRSELGKASFDISKFITLCSLDIISEAALGKSFNAQEDSESQYVSSLKIMCKMVMERSFNVFLFNDFLYSFTKLYQEEKEALRYLYSSFENIIKERHNLIYNHGNCDGSLTFLDFILEEKLKKQTFTHQAVHDNVQTMIFAGHDTTSSALNFTIYLLGDHPQVQQQILDEYLTVMENKSEVLSISHLNQLKYLDAVIKESLRLYPPVPYISRAGSSFEYGA
uniref:Cytochrome P450 n=2 Tax=Photinus pyralis TaxID=7054 RepID=A0A1Y1JSC2_PHOPY